MSETKPEADVAETPTPEQIAEWKKKAAERDQYFDLALRTRAEFDNYQKRNQKDLAIERRYAYGPLVRDLLPVIDNLERALGAAKQSGDAGPLATGVANVQSLFLDLLKRNGIVRIEAAGQTFDPNLHEAIMQLPSPDQEPNTIVQVVECGFQYHDRLLRPAKVVVSTRPA